MDAEIRILIVDDHNLIAEAWSTIINAEEGLTVEGIAASQQEAVELALNLRPNIVLMDINLEQGNGYNACQEITNKLPKVSVVGLSIHDDLSIVKNMIAKGASGYLTKNCSAVELKEAIRTVFRGEEYLSKDIKEKYVQSMFNKTDAQKELTRREIEIITLIADGLTSKEIGDQLSVSNRTIDSHRHNILKKLQIPNSAQLCKWAMEKGYV